jgi:uncharacterized protein
MECPACRVPLVMAERSGVEIDYCPQCRGIWLDRGELDKIIERSERGGLEPVGRQVHGGDDHHDHEGHDRHQGGPYRSPHGHGGRKSLWRELFD